MDSAWATSSSNNFQTPTTSKAQPLLFGTNNSLLKKKHILSTPTSRVLSPQLPRSKQGQVNSIHCGAVFTFGSGDCDQLGHGKVDDGEEMIAKVPTKVDLRSAKIGPGDICAVACGGLHTTALTSAGEILSWGCNDDEALGRVCSDHVARLTQFYAKYAPEKTKEFIQELVQKYKDSTTYCTCVCLKNTRNFQVESRYPVVFRISIVFDSSWSIVVIVTLLHWVPTEEFTLSVRTILMFWRENTQHTQLEKHTGTYKDSNGYIGFNADGVKKQLEPREVDGLYKINGPMTQISCGSHHTCAVSKSGLLLVWGDAEHGQLGQRHRPLKKHGLRVHAVGFRSTLKLKKQIVVFVTCSVTRTVPLWRWVTTRRTHGVSITMVNLELVPRKLPSYRRKSKSRMSKSVKSRVDCIIPFCSPRKVTSTPLDEVTPDNSV